MPNGRLHQRFVHHFHTPLVQEFFREGKAEDRTNIDELGQIREGGGDLKLTLTVGKPLTPCSEHNRLFFSSSQSTAYKGISGCRPLAALLYSGTIRWQWPHHGATNATRLVCCIYSI